MEEETQHNEIYHNTLKKTIEQMEHKSIKERVMENTFQLFLILSEFHQKQYQMKSVFLNGLTLFLIQVIKHKYTHNATQFKNEIVMKEFEDQTIQNEFINWCNKTIALCTLNDNYLNILFNYYSIIIFDIQHYFEIFSQYDSKACKWLNSFKELLTQFFNIPCSFDPLTLNKQINRPIDLDNSNNSKERISSEDDVLPKVQEIENDLVLFEDTNAAKVSKTTTKTGTVVREIEGEKDMLERFKGSYLNEPLGQLRSKSECDTQKLCLRNRDFNGFSFRSPFISRLIAHEEITDDEQSENSFERREKTTPNEINEEEQKMNEMILKTQKEMDRQMKEREDKSLQTTSLLHNQQSCDKSSLISDEINKEKSLEKQEKKEPIQPVSIQKENIHKKFQNDESESLIHFQIKKLFYSTVDSVVIKIKQKFIEIVDGKKRGNPISCVFDCDDEGLNMKCSYRVYVYPFEQSIFDQQTYHHIQTEIIKNKGLVSNYLITINNTKHPIVFVCPATRISMCLLPKKTCVKQPNLTVIFPIPIYPEKNNYYVVYHNYLRRRDEKDIISFHVVFNEK
ncbi:hypothetical protein EHI8A_108380 [Entamoeba histolytica HM-1:IMSS-B]|uniref:Uncharacterized protein n=6 Tax=Entamoeba histolytica TaxID=5759 RepID=C4M3V8_ENTH1|nr:hypothetical protein EHI_016360 [Entamoeba histolytica HM-1:IMSS]EMD48339.1 Hypothetical protein EHI5A_139820 [Entamoeba histolytica KU27]EMH72044.1 hypothetical protein EHI8A_108380 [Entamoeba histolytica HM-1:IMSS-B]ENY63189.1 hypothetical protein EHI7A_101380 [Entamoeba histolytica HM-1:IMSS-A]GAT96024.1 hypothetical protein CL6EHI_016360 [Entamoeba histolytica]EAL48127.1 hypothetical protein EHI_016360 [Entamoeba histolytica HM-1:IMSS]|eukprot:XP_653513.1 hypothetical protein EHI_016360 [Entamoeba histolytica HM-1:IMSS]